MSPDELDERRGYIFALKRSGQLADALEEIRAVRQAGCDSPLLDVDEADLLARLGKPQEALRLLESGKPLSVFGRALRAWLLHHFKRDEEANLIFEELAGHEKLPLPVARRVVDHFRKSDPERSARLAQSWAPQGAEGATWLAQVLAKSRDTEGALAVLERELQKAPHDDRLLREYIQLRLQEEGPEAMAEELETLLSMKDLKNSLRLKERLMQAYRKLGEYERARTLILDCLRQRPENLYFQSNLAYVERDLGNIDAALDLFESVLSADPTEKFARGAYFSTCKKNSCKDRAVAFVAALAKADARALPMWGQLKKWDSLK